MGTNPWLPNAAAEEIADLRLEARHHERCGDGAQQRAQLPAGQPGHGVYAAELRRRCGPSANGRFQLSARAKRRRQVFARQREVELNLCAGRPHAPAIVAESVISAMGVIPAIGSLENAPSAYDTAPMQPAVDVHGAAAHAGDDTGVGQRPAFEAGENQIATRADHVLEHAEDVDLELFDARAFEYRPAHGDHAGTDFIHVHLREPARRPAGEPGGLSRSVGDCGAAATSTPSPVSCQQERKGEPADVHGFDSIIREKCLLVKEKWPFDWHGRAHRDLHQPRQNYRLCRKNGWAYSAAMRRRDFLSGMAVAPLAVTPLAAAIQSQPGASRSGRIKQSVMGSVWGTSNLSFEERCRTLARIGFKAVDLPTAEQVPILKANGLTPAMMTGTGTSFQDGLIRKEMHDKFEEAFRKGIDMCVEVGCPNLIGLPGERRGMSYEEGADNAVAILSRVKGYAEQKGVTLCMEITNSKVVADQRTDQIFNHLAWGFDVCRRVNSPRVKIVYDIYHVQIADGDVTRNMRDNLNTSATSMSPASQAATRSTTRRSSTTVSSPMRSRTADTRDSSPTNTGPRPAATLSRASNGASRSWTCSAQASAGERRQAGYWL